MFSDLKGPALASQSSHPVGSTNGPRPLTAEVDVYVMPGKFLPEKPLKKSGSAGNKKIIIIASVILALLAASVAGAIMYLNARVNKVRNNDGLALVNNANQNANQAPISNDAGNSVQNQNPDGQNTNSISNAAPPTSASTPPKPSDNPPPPADNLDTDNDGLTVDEESLFLTNIARDDTDRDGYKDGQEVINLFNPLVPSQALENSGLVSRYKNDDFAYSVLVPKAWLPSPANTDNSEMMFLSNSETGEFISIKAQANTAGQTLAVLKSAYFSAGEQTENFTLGGQPAWRIKTKVLMVTEQHIYVLEYQQNQSAQAHFPAVLEMMLKSFQLHKADDTELQP